MNYINIEEILFMHYRMLCELQPYNENFVVMNPAGLESAINRPLQSAFGEDAYTDIYSKAAALTESLISNHIFNDGNKRVGITAGCVFMYVNGYSIDVTNNDIYEIAIKTAGGELEYDQIREWFETHFYKS